MSRTVLLVLGIGLVGSTLTACTDYTSARNERSGTTIVGPECERGDGKEIDHLPDIVIDAITSPAVTAETSTVGRVTVPAVDVPGVSIRKEVVDGGCVIHYKTSPGCLGAVEITPVTIPDATIPGYRLSVGSTVAQGDTTVKSVQEAGSSIPGDRVDEVCGAKLGEIPLEGLFRPSVHRQSGYRPAVHRPGAAREPVCVKNACTPLVAVAGVSIPALTMQAVTVPAEALTREGATDSGARTYVGGTDVFFDVDQSTLRPEAVRTLRDIATAIRGSGDTGTIIVEGHTDSTAGAAYNMALSLERARSVADWLGKEGKLGGWDIKTRGYGETRPAASNDTEAGRQANRRVVIRVRG